MSSSPWLVRCALRQRTARYYPTGSFKTFGLTAQAPISDLPPLVGRGSSSCGAHPPPRRPGPLLLRRLVARLRRGFLRSVPGAGGPSFRRLLPQRFEVVVGALAGKEHMDD